jgi:hypothetical protein
MSRSLLLPLHRAAPVLAEDCELFLEGRSGFEVAAPSGSDAIPPQQAVLVLGQAGEGQEEDALFWPAGFCGEGEDLGG